MKPIVRFYGETAKVEINAAIVYVPAVDITFELADPPHSAEARHIIQNGGCRYGAILVEVGRRVTYRFSPRAVWKQGFRESAALDLETLVTLAQEALDTALAEIKEASCF